jgi:hypothetical protein
MRGAGRTRGEEDDAQRCAWWTRRPFHKHVLGIGVGKVGAKLGRIWAKLANGPKIKVATDTKLYDFYLVSQVIRVTD